jgi:hypothetical protein
MSLFNRNKPAPVEAEPTLEEQSEYMKGVAIEYMVSLSKADLERFISGVDQVWQGYNNSLDKVKTKHQRQLERNARANGMDVNEDADLLDLFEDEPATPPVRRTTVTVTNGDPKDPKTTEAK